MCYNKVIINPYIILQMWLALGKAMLNKRHLHKLYLCSPLSSTAFQSTQFRWHFSAFRKQGSDVTHCIELSVIWDLSIGNGHTPLFRLTWKHTTWEYALFIFLFEVYNHFHLKIIVMFIFGILGWHPKQVVLRDSTDRTSAYGAFTSRRSRNWSAAKFWQVGLIKMFKFTCH